MRQACIILALLLAVAAAAGQSLPASKEQVPHETASSRIAELERQVKHYRYYKQDSAIYFANEGIAYARKHGDSTGVAAMLLQLGMIDDNQGAFERARGKYDQALEIYKAHGSKKGIAAATIRIGVVELRNGKYDNAIRYFFEALKLSEQIADRFGAMEAIYSISWAWLDQKNYPKALTYLEAADSLNRLLPFSNISLNIYNHFGVAYRETKKYAKAKEYLSKGIALSDQPEYQGLNITMINNLAAVYAMEGHTAKAISLQEQALQRSRQIGNYLRELQTLQGLSKSYAKSNPERSVFYIKQAVELARKKNVPRQEIRFLHTLTTFYKSQGNYKEALASKEREHDLADSFFHQTTSRNMEALKAEYDLSRSNARIKELHLINNKRQLELKNATTLRTVTLGGIVLLLIILGLLYNQYRIKQRNSREANLRNQSLEKLLDEKEWLLKEVHHRVKNNLQTVMSLLETQSSYLKDDALVAVQNSQHRVYAMSLIHQKLYQDENTTSIDLSVYLPELIAYLSDSYDVRSRIRFRSHIQHIQLDISQAIPVGLIFNEAISNAIKYAFPGGRKGIISIEITRSGDKTIRLSVADDGVGLPDGWEMMHENSLGLRLMKGLSEDIQARFSIKSDHGTHVNLEFRERILSHEKKYRQTLKPDLHHT